MQAPVAAEMGWLVSFRQSAQLNDNEIVDAEARDDGCMFEFMQKLESHPLCTFVDNWPNERVEKIVEDAH